MKAWSWQCHDCYGAHKDIIVKTGRPTAHHVGCPFCGGEMRVYELGRGFRARPPVRPAHVIGKPDYRKAA